MKVARLLSCRNGASAAEFALVLPLLLLLLFGIIDGGRFLWELNRAQKATQSGARFAAVTHMVPSSLASYSFATGTQVPTVIAGTPVPVTSFTNVSCTWDRLCEINDPDNVCKISQADIGPAPGFDSAAFGRIVDRMRSMYPAINNSNVRITYCNVGLGFAGDPYGPDVAPQIVVSVRELFFTPVTFLLLAQIRMPPSIGSMTLEDGIGNLSN
jgi:hypothetical protein